MEENIRVLQEKNADYTMNLQSLVDSPERIAQEGRSLGYLGINEVALTIKNRKSPPVSTANAGFLLSYTAPVLCQDKTARLYALSLGVLVFLVYGFLLFIKNRKIR